MRCVSARGTLPATVVTARSSSLLGAREGQEDAPGVVLAGIAVEDDRLCGAGGIGQALDRFGELELDPAVAPVGDLVVAEWYRLRTVAEANGDHVRTIALNRDRFPMLFGRRQLHVGRIELFGIPIPGKHPTTLPMLRQPDDAVVALGAGAALGPLVHRTAVVDVNVQDGEADSMWRLSVAPSDVATSLDQLDDLLLVCHYDVRPIAN